jgi:hypothetical protein
MMEHVTDCCYATVSLSWRGNTRVVQRSGREREKMKLISKERRLMWGKRDRREGVKHKGRSEERLLK